MHLADGPSKSDRAMPSVIGWRHLLRLSAPAIALASLLYLPFLNKAYTIDDPYFLLEAEQTKREPLRPLNFNLCWFDSLHCAPAYASAPGAALMGYFLIPVLALSAAEPAVHAAQLILLWIAVIFTVSLALRMAATEFEARAAGILLVVFPPVLAMTDTAMPDVLVMTLGVIGIDRYLAWLEDGGVSNAGAAGIALGLAPFGRMHALGLIGVAAVAAYLHRRKEGRARIRLARAALPLCFAGALFATLTLLTRERGITSAMPPDFNLGRWNIEPNARALLFDFLVCFPVAGFWLAHMRRRAVMLIPLSAAIFAALYFVAGVSRWNSAVWALNAISIICLLHLLWCGWQARSLPLMLLVWLLVPCLVLPYRHLPPKLVMIGAPAAAIAAIGWLRSERPQFRRWVFGGAASACALVSILVLRADQRFAELPRQAAAELVAPAVQRGEGVWFAGHWGIYWYAAKAGATVVVPGVSEPASGDLLLTEQFEGRDPILDRYPRRHLLGSCVFAWKGGRVMSWRNRAGLYSNGWGPLPVSFGAGEVDRFELWRID